ncbi:RebB family R body protein [Kordiimonas lacus]|uniref:Killing trait domain-containing protein n=1 Tax=Kordiimonas lacus TaxID=637679 RepID=A0A1G7C9P1_9PROT|nr:RebB family R body protein [Kordiimonas lacus]SDE36102.1 Killing trait domain-containing protein [Kordiimonas lacus]
MADNTPVNSQITDAITQTNVTVLGEAPAMAIGALSQAMSSSLAVMFANATAAQQQQNIVAQAATAQGVATIYGAGRSEPDTMLSLMTALKATQEVD